MKQQRILITGAGGGIGLACVRLFLKKGWKVVAHYHKTSKMLFEIQRKVGEENLAVKKCNFTDIEEIKKFLSMVGKMDFDALVNNAAVYDFSSQRKNRIKALQDVALVNMIVPALLAEKVIERMKKKNKGYIINVGSIGAKYGSSLKNVFYGMSKGGIETLTRSLAREGAGYNILINTVRPGVTDTHFHQRLGKDMNKRRQMIPLKRLAQPEEVAGLIFFLCARNTFITNETVTIAGGE